MNARINVKVPCSIVLPYTLYVQGMNISKPVLDEDGSCYTFTYPGDTVFILFYTFEKFRRCFIVTGWNEGLGMDKVRLPGVDADLSLLYEARGRKIDELKRILHLLVKDDEYGVFRFDYLFWFRLTALIESTGGKKWEVEKLYRDCKRKYEDERSRNRTENDLCTEVSSGAC